jgi:hypothetical protein
VPDISLFQPTVLLGVVEKFTAPENLTMLNRIDKTPHPYPTAQWDVIRGSRAIARPNVPNSEAHIVPQLGRETLSAAFLYLREKKVFSPTTLYWVRTPGEIAKVNAEKAVKRELEDLNRRFDNFAEYAIWQMLTGVLDVKAKDGEGDSPDIYVDYKLPTSHKPNAGTSWATATPQQIIADVRSWKRLVDRDGQVPAREAYASEQTITRIFDSFALSGTTPAFLLSDRMKDQYYGNGTLPNFLGIDWHIQDSVFDATGASYGPNPTDPGAEQKFLADNRIVFGNFTDGRPFEMIVGPTADLSAPQGYTGKFAKTFFEPDPSARQYLLEWHFLPVLNKPEQVVYANVG